MNKVSSRKETDGTFKYLILHRDMILLVNLMFICFVKIVHW